MLGALKNWSPLPLRLLVGLGFISHSVPRLFGTAGHMELSAAMQELGVPYPGPAAWIASAVEFLGGLAVLQGVIFPVATALLLLDLLGALAVAYLHGGWRALGITTATATGPQLGMPGAHVNLLYAAALLSLLLGGAGPLSLSVRSRRRAPPSPSAPSAAPPREAHA